MIVYFHRNQQTKEVFYVGIGIKKDRAFRMNGAQRNRYWHNYIKKHGIPIVDIVHEVATRAEAIELELKYIAQFGRRCDGSGCLVNITIGGDGGSWGVKQSAELIKKRTLSLKGKKYTEEERKRMKEVQNRPDVKAKHASYHSDPIWREKQRQAKLGKKLSEDHKRKISEGNKGKVLDETTKAKISASNSGKVRTLEVRKRLSEIRKGIKPSAELILKRSESHKKVLLNTQTGIYYLGMKDAAESLAMPITTFRCQMAGFQKNKTPFIYA